MAGGRGGDGIVVFRYVDTSYNTQPTLTSMDDGNSIDQVVVGGTLYYTVTFDHDIDASTVTAADFDNEGDADISIGTIAESITEGVFSVEVTPTSAGSLKLRIPAGADIRDPANNLLVVPASDNTTVTVVDSIVAVGAATTVTNEIAGTYYVIHTFAADGFLLTPQALDIDYLVVAGGGGGGGHYGGGGGAGGLLSGSTTLGPEVYTITVGAGGDGGRPWTGSTRGANGGSSSIADPAATVVLVNGGGGGGTRGGTTGGLAGGSGGGGGGERNRCGRCRQHPCYHTFARE